MFGRNDFENQGRYYERTWQRIGCIIKIIDGIHTPDVLVGRYFLFNPFETVEFVKAQRYKACAKENSRAGYVLYRNAGERRHRMS